MVESVENMNQEIVNATIDYYKNLQAIKRANGEHENKVLNYEIKCTRTKLESFGVNLQGLEFEE